MLFEVALRTSLRRLFTYESDQELQRGVRVRVPFRSKEVTGFVWAQTEKAPKGLKRIEKVLDEAPLFDSTTLNFYEKAANYYAISLGDLLATSIPQKVREGKDISVPSPKHFVPELVKLSSQQSEIAEKIRSSFGKFQTHLLMGEMGSGKTEIYLSLIEQILIEGGQALFLVPEISLTPQLEDRLSERLGGRVSVFHSQISEKKREEAFARIWNGQTDIVLGARSALFLPFKDLKLIVADEEHDHSYKQAERGPYHARDLALLRAQLLKIPVVLGSATPSLESYSRALQSNAPIYRLAPYFGKSKIEMKVIDLKKTFEDEGRQFISDDLHTAISARLQKNEQSLLFLNRRGSASQRICLSCGALDECRACSVVLTIHSDLHRGICHWCGYQKTLKTECEACGSEHFFLGGIGTKEVETQIRARFPEARIARLDRDQAHKKNILSDTLRNFAEGRIDILIGTQMISKGIDIPNLSLVGVILADQGWGLPDFRGSERSYQLLRQLMGRAGRRGQHAQFIAQTFVPEHPIFEALAREENSFEEFARAELEIRKLAVLPPFSKMALFLLTDKSEATLSSAAQSFVRRIQPLAKSLGIALTGPISAPIARLKGVFRMHLLAKDSPKGHMTTFLTAVLDDLDSRPLSVKVKIDRDPYNFM